MIEGVVSTNKQGQSLGRKGLATRGRLMNATRQLLKTVSPIELTAVSIAKQAKTSSATFYMYFDDVKDIMFALSREAASDLAAIEKIFDEPWDPKSIDYDRALRLVEEFDAAWDRHREILRYRNLEADRGDARFEEAKVQSYLPLIKKIAAHILSAYPEDNAPKKSDAYAEAATLYAALEGVAEADPKVVNRGLGMKRMQQARARVIAHVLGRRGNGDGWYASGKARSSRRKTTPKPSDELVQASPQD
ncbi:transcriptional regulator (plasmid) [Azospirillum sp. B510]|uniref:TetR/AcrR family transcriptional regulator n=1 Tax=Azospirillum sp. (strain B510) TaxID=137722 RepID=UPI0001C4CC0A|nr:TetR/AcrR family transcriptional regulator [Azospirillum sp. B510]BAI74864.1 transcriptional regulator [Azospirillum sp. B510]